MSETDYFSGDPKLLWQDQIAGVIDFDYSDFLGALADLQTDPNWRQAFTAIENETGMVGFLTRVQQHFDLCQSPHNPDGSVSPYQHPGRTVRGHGARDETAMIGLMQRHLKTITDAVHQAYGDDGDVAVTKLRQMKIAWTNDWASISDDRDERDEDELNVSIYESMSEIDDDCERDGVPEILSCLREACYGLAASYELQRYLMQDFYSHQFDVDALYELEWVNGCDFRIHGDTCVVFDLVARKTHKEASNS